ncbi:MAG: ribose-phosphate diphosphokinase [Spirochaetota bacterium]
MDDLIVVGTESDNPFVEDIVEFLNQQEDYSDLISLKCFSNTEFCPRFIINEHGWNNIGQKLNGKTILIASSSVNNLTRNDLAMRNFLVARAAKDNGASRVILLEPDLFYSAQDRGPRPEHGIIGFIRDPADYKKFDGQPFSARMYADLLQRAGVDEVVTIHNHSSAVKNIFMDRLSGYFHNLQPADVYASYMKDSDIINEKNLILCAPDRGAISFLYEVQGALGRPDVPLLFMEKIRTGEREVSMEVGPLSPSKLEDVTGKDVAVIDDMVRTGLTIVECCRLIKKVNPRRIILFVTHFYSSREARVNLNDPVIDEIVTTNTIPQILNKDMQGRLRHKLVVLRLEKWIANYLLEMMGAPPNSLTGPLYREEISSKNPRWKGKMGPLFSSLYF